MPETSIKAHSRNFGFHNTHCHWKQIDGAVYSHIGQLWNSCAVELPELPTPFEKKDHCSVFLYASVGLEAATTPRTDSTFHVGYPTSYQRRK